MKALARAVFGAIDPALWYAIRALKRPDAYERRFGRCRVFGGPEFQSLMEVAARRIQDASAGLWQRIQNQSFWITEEFKEGVAKRIWRSRFCMYREFCDAGSLAVAYVWICDLFLAEELSGISYIGRLRYSDPHDSQARARAACIEAFGVEAIEKAEKAIEQSRGQQAS